MKTDTYTKIILTVIAIFLGVLIFQNTSVISTVQASTVATAPIPTQSNVVDVNITHIAGIEIDPEGKKSMNSFFGFPVQIQKNLDK